jgi:hypothetical protein
MSFGDFGAFAFARRIGHGSDPIPIASHKPFLAGRFRAKTDKSRAHAIRLLRNGISSRRSGPIAGRQSLE